MKHTSCLVLVSFACACAVSAADSLQPESPDQSQAFRLEAFEALAKAETSIASHRLPQPLRINIAISQSGLSKRRISQLDLAVDDQPPVHYFVPAAAATAIAEFDEQRRVGQIALAPGPHTLHAEFSVSVSDKPEAASEAVQTDYRFERREAASDIEFRLDPGTLIGTRIKARTWAPDLRVPRKVLGVVVEPVAIPGASELLYRPGSDSDPALRQIRHLDRLGESDTALLELLQMASAASSEVPLAADYWLESATVSRRLGLLDRAQQICDQLDARHELAGAVATERLAIATAQYEAGNLDEADAQLKQARSTLPEFRRSDWRYVSGMVLIARQRPADAVPLLAETNSETIDAFRYMNASTETLRATAYGRFNLAVAMVNSGDERRGLSWLDLLGRSAPNDPEMMALRDKANLALGWHFLKAKQGRTALGVLGRVRSEGPLSDRALLGMGWAQLAPDGERLPRVQLAVDPPRAPDQINDLSAPLKNSLARLRVLEPELHDKVGPRSFEREDPPKNREAGLRRALQVWSVLLGRDEREPEVVEAMLATGYAYDQLHDQPAARSAYSRTISTLRQMQSDIRNASDIVKDGRLVAAMERTLGQDDLFRFMDSLRLAPGDDTHLLYAAVETHRDLSLLRARLVDTRDRLAAVSASDRDNAADHAVMAQLDAAIEHVDADRAAAGHDVQTLAADHLKARKTSVDTYLKSALLLAARVDEQPVLESRQSSRP